MKKILGLFSLLTAIVIASISAQANTTIYTANGIYWNALDENDKVSLSAGFIVGFSANNLFMLNSPKINDAGKEIISQVNKLLINVSPKMLAAAVDAYYNNEEHNTETLVIAFVQSLIMMKNQ